MELVPDSDTDEPVAIDPPRRATRSRSGSAKTARSGKSGTPSGTRNLVAKSQPKSTRLVPTQSSSSSSDGITILDAPPAPKRGRPRKPTPPPEEEDEEVIFVRETTVRGLAARFTYASGSAGETSRSRSKTASLEPSRTRPTPSASNIPSASTTPSFTLYPDRDPLPIPDWLGKPAVLLQLQTCVVCRAKEFKRQSGPERWRHISTCLPPLFRPPNPPPDLKALISDALQPARDMTLLAHHTARDDERKAGKTKPKLNVTTVTANHSREGWADEVSTRVSRLVGSSPRRRRSLSRSRSRSRSPHKRRSLSTTASPRGTASPTPDRTDSPQPDQNLPSTQPLGESSLASEYARPPRTRSPSPEILLQAPPRIGLTQSVRAAFEREEAALTQRSEAALSQAVRRRHMIPAEHEDGGGCFAPSQSQSLQSLAQSIALPGTQTFCGGRFTFTPQSSSSSPFSAGGARGPGRFPQSTAERGRAARRRAIAVALASDALEALSLHDHSDWGDDAVMTWEGRDDDWGADACMEWHGAADVLEASGANETLGERNDLEEMPDYSSWNTVELQRLVVGFGYRASRDRGALVDIAVACWEAGARSSGKGDGDKVKGRGKDKNSKTQDSKDKEKEIPTRPTAPPTPAELDTQFYRMIRDDTAFWTRILRYEPIAFDELISRALLAGISGAGWKDALKRFLDARGVAYYTADPTGPRRRR